MHGLMMNTPLTITSLMQFADNIYPNTAIVSVTTDNPHHRYHNKDCFCRVRQLANALSSLGLSSGDRVATLAWNDYRHLELYYGISCSGLVCHTLNPKISPEHLVYIINQAEVTALFVDALMVPLLAAIQAQLSTLQHVVVLTDKQHLPADCLYPTDYESLIAEQSEQFDWPQLDEETAAALCYTSGTTGLPKGVLYSHRSMVLHAYAGALPDVLSLSAADTMMPVVPMFHVNAWGVPYSTALTGAKLVLPGPKMLDGAVLTALINREQVSVAAGVPTIWQALLEHLTASGETVDSLQRVLVGGSACPLSIMEAFDRYGVYTHAAWGMTETSPLGAVNRYCDRTTVDQAVFKRRRVKAGYPAFGIDIRIVDDNGQPLPHDGETIGHLQVRGPWVCRQYYRSNEHDAAFDAQGWFDTSDLATIDGDGLLDIIDRGKDIIKSGGEWISSIVLENIANDHPDVHEAGVIAVADPKWIERPLLLAVKKPDSTLDSEQLLHWFEDKVEHWQIPERCVFVEELPHTATGKVDKKQLREIYCKN